MAAATSPKAPQLRAEFSITSSRVAIPRKLQLAEQHPNQRHDSGHSCPARRSIGVFEEVPGSGEWWIQYFDSDHRRRREKIDSKSAAKKLVEKRRSDALAGIKMPENLRAKPVTFDELAKHALAYSKANKSCHGHDKWRMPALVDAFGTRAAENIKPDEIQQWLDSKADVWSPATRNRYLALMKLAYRPAERSGSIKANPLRLVRARKENNERVRYWYDAEETSLRGVIAKSCSELPEFEIALMTACARVNNSG